MNPIGISTGPIETRANSAQAQGVVMKPPMLEDTIVAMCSPIHVTQEHILHARATVLAARMHRVDCETF